MFSETSQKPTLFVLSYPRYKSDPLGWGALKGCFAQNAYLVIKHHPQMLSCVCSGTINVHKATLPNPPCLTHNPNKNIITKHWKLLFCLNQLAFRLALRVLYVICFSYFEYNILHTFKHLVNCCPRKNVLYITLRWTYNYQYLLVFKLKETQIAI